MRVFYIPDQDIQGYIPDWDLERFTAKWPDAYDVASQICPCKQKDRIVRLSKYARIPPKHERCTFMWFDDQPESGGKKRARKAAEIIANGEMFASDLGPKPGLILSGPVGVGKSGLAASAAKMILSRGIHLMWIDANEFLEEIYQAQERSFARERGVSDDGPVNPFAFVEEVATIPFLVFDDFGDLARSKPITDYQRDKFYSVIRTRYEKELPSIITTNLTPAQMGQQFGPRIADRLVESWLWVEMTGVNFRSGLL